MRSNRLRRIGAVCAGVLMLSSVSGVALAQDIDSLRKKYRLQELPVDVIAAAINVSRVQPGSSSGSPSAFGANMGDGFIGAGYQNQTRYVGPKPSVLDDGGIVGGFGLGDAREYAGLEVAISSFSTVREGFGKRGGVSLKLHRLLPDDFGVAIGRESAISWGGTDGGRSWYGVLSKVVGLTANPNGFLGSVVLNAGLGDGRFRDSHLVTLPNGQQEIGAPTDSIGFFASAGLRVHETTSLIADWGGSDLTVGLSIVPFGSVPFVLAPAIADVLARANGHGRFILGVGYGFRLSQLAHF
jgi:hypothetical protein